MVVFPPVLGFPIKYSEDQRANEQFFELGSTQLFKYKLIHRQLRGDKEEPGDRKLRKGFDETVGSLSERNSC